jgi:hypothetical protein
MSAEPTSNETGPIDFKKAKADYSLLIAMLKWGGVASLIVAFLVLIIIAN